MVNINGKNAKWIGCIEFNDGISITQHIFTQDIVKFLRDQNKKYVSDVNKINAYVFPYILNEAKKQDKNISSISVKEVELGEA